MTTTLYLCEKPSQGRDIARVLGANHKGEGHLRGTVAGQALVVTWCYGHLLEMLPPDGYDPSYQRWALETLPIIPSDWRLTVKPPSQAQFTTIKTLLQDAGTVVIATDADREGEVIAREVLARCRWQGTVQRLWLSALDEASIRKALAALLPGEKTEPLYQAGLGRSRADWLVGMNLTRAYTVAGRRAGYDGVLSVGRVQTPTLKLVVDRDRAIETFVPQDWFDLHALFALPGDPAFPLSADSPDTPAPATDPERRFSARWLVPKAHSDEEGRCLKREVAEQVATDLQQAQGQVTKADTQRQREPAPLPFDLSTLQQVASRRWGLGAQQVLDAAQSLYETHKATTYPRSDCPYLPTSQHAEAPGVLAAVAASDPGLAKLVAGADPQRRSRAWDDSQITAHHAIIPTGARVALARMSLIEQRIYDLIRRRFLAQFYPLHEYDRTTVEVAVASHRFRTTGRVERVSGWKMVLGSEAPPEKPEDEEPALPAMTTGEATLVLDTPIAAKQTRPPSRYTEGTLIAAMKNVGRTVADPKLRKVLRETAGIGTEATRAAILENLIKRQLLAREGRRHLISLPAGRALIDVLPDPVKDPATTALWEQRLDAIAHGTGELAAFLERQGSWVSKLVQQVKDAGLPQGLAGLVPPDILRCPLCGAAMARRQGSKGPFWGCRAYPSCRGTRPDEPTATGVKPVV